MTMGALLSWTILSLCGATGAWLLARGVQGLAADHQMARRLRAQILPGLPAPWTHARGQALLEKFGRRIAGAGTLQELQDLLLRAGFLSTEAVFIFAGLRLIAALAVAGLAVVPGYWRDGAISSGDAAAAFFSGFFMYRGFTTFLKLRAESRQRAIRRELPYALDLLLMVLDSGVSVDQALQHVGQQIGQAAPLCAEMLGRYLSDIEDGMPYDKALDRLGQRLAVREGRDFAGLLKQNLFQGGELGQPLRQLAIDIGEARLAHAREQMGRKSVLLTLAMLAFFMPVLLLAIAAPAVSDVLGTLRHAAQDLQAMGIRK